MNHVTSLPFTSFVQIAAALYIFYVSAIALNRMTRETSPMLRWAHIGLCCGAVAGAASCFVSRDLFECIFTVGMALFMAVHRRFIR